MVKKQSEADLTQRLAISLAAGEDPVTAAESAAGVGRNQLNPEIELALVFEYNQMKTDKAEWEGDTFFNMSRDYFLNILQKQGFELVYTNDFKATTWGKDNTEEFNVWVNRDKGYLVSANSYSKKSKINSTHLYFELALPATYERLTETQRDFIYKIRGSREALIVNGSMVANLFYRLDAREGLVRSLQEVESSTLSTNVPWKNVLPRQLYLLQLYDFADVQKMGAETETPFGSLQIKNKRTLDKLPKDIQEMLGWIDQ